MKPLIGITANVDFDWKHTLGNDYLQAVIQAGGIPIILPAGVIGDAAHLAKKLDGLVLSGGGDIDPTLFGDEPHQKLGSISPGRDHYEIELIQHMLKLDKPILAICRGIQILNIAVEGDMYQDIYSQIDSPVIQHTQNAVRYHLSHYVQVEKNSLLAEIAGQVQFKVNSFHHQAVRKVVQPFEVVARSSDGVIEAIESKLHKFVVGVQWHPEPLAVHGDPISQRIFQRFIQSSI